MSETVKSVDRAMDILLLLHNSMAKIGVTDISNSLDLQKSTVHRILSSMEQKGFVRKGEDEKYGIGLQIFAMGMKVSKEYSIIEIIKPYIKKLMNEVGEAINVSVMSDNSVGIYQTVIIDKEYPTDSVLLVNPKVGSYTDAHISSVGKCLLAFSKSIDLDRINDENLKRYTVNTIDNKDKLIKELDKVKKCGYAIDNEEREVGLYCIGVPIFNSKNEAILAISISGPTVRMKNSDLNKKIETLRRIQSEINIAIKKYN